MNAQTEAPKPTPTIKRKSRKPSTPRAPRVVDPAIEAINEYARNQRHEVRKSKVSARILSLILVKRLHQLTKSDQQALFEDLRSRLTPPAAAEERA